MPRRPRTPEAIAAEKQRRHAQRVSRVLGQVERELELFRVRLEQQISKRKAIEEHLHSGPPLPLAAKHLDPIAGSSVAPALNTEAQHRPDASYPDFKFRIRALGTPIRGTVRIRYLKADGSLSERTVEVQFVYPTRGYPSHFLAFCQLRGEDRTFAVANVMSVKRHQQLTPSRHAEVTPGC